MGSLLFSNSSEAGWKSLYCKYLTGPSDPKIDLYLGKKSPFDPKILSAMDDQIPQIEKSAYRELDRSPGTPGLIRFNEVIDEALRKDPEYAGTLFKLSLNRLPYLKREGVVVFLSGGVADPWTNGVIQTAVREGVKIDIVKLPGSLSFARGGNMKTIPAFPEELKTLLQNRSAIFLDDTYTNGGTASAVRESVKRSGGELDGVFVVYEGGKGNPASLYKTGRNNRRPPSMENFPRTPESWRWKDATPLKIAIEIRGTLLREDGGVTRQGARLLSELDRMGAEILFLDGGKPVGPPKTFVDRFKSVRYLESNATADFAIGNWGRSFRADERLGPAPLLPHLETVRIGAYRDEGILSEDLLDENYFMNRLSENGIFEPVYGNRAASSLVVDGEVRIFDLRTNIAVARSPGDHALAEVLAIEDPKSRVAKLSAVSWSELTPTEQNLLLEHAGVATNSFELGQIIRIAAGSDDSRWVPILNMWSSAWKQIGRGWQTFLLPEAEKALNILKGAR